MQTARNLVAAAAEFSARVKFGQNDLDCGFAFFFDNAGRNTSAVVRNANRAVRENFHDDMRAVACERFVD